MCRITNVELERGFERLGLQRCNMKKVCCLVAADGIVDVVEFMRTFSWHDVHNVEKSIYEAKLQVHVRQVFIVKSVLINLLEQKKVIISRAMDRIAVLQQSGKENAHKVQEVFGQEHDVRVFSDSVHIYKETLHGQHDHKIKKPLNI